MYDTPRCLTVMYHYVRDRAGTPEADIRGLSSDAFAGQVDELASRFEPVDWPTLDAARTGGRSLPPDSFLMTFDDGLRDHVEVVAPILERRGLRGVFFVSGQPIADRRMDSAHRIHLLLARLGEQRFTQSVRGWLENNNPRGDWFARVDARTAGEMYHYEAPPLRLVKFLLTVVLPIDLRNRLTAELFAEHVGDEARWADRWYPGWEGLRALQSAGHTIGGHGYRHEPYLRLTPEHQRTDARHMAGLLAQQLGPGARPFSYPYGSYDEGAMRACRHAGFAAAFTTQTGFVTPADRAFELPRVDTIAVSQFLQSGARDPIGEPT